MDGARLGKPSGEQSDMGGGAAVVFVAAACRSAKAKQAKQSRLNDDRRRAKVKNGPTGQPGILHSFIPSTFCRPLAKFRLWVHSLCDVFRRLFLFRRRVAVLFSFVGGTPLFVRYYNIH